MKQVLYLLLLLPQLLWSQNDIFDLQHFSIKDGLPDHQTLHIEQDKDGYIWGNTIGSLFRYDGYQFKIYRKRELGVSGTEFVNFAIDDEGFVWYFDFSVLPLNIQILDAQDNNNISIDDFFKNKLPFPSKEITRIYRDKRLGFVILTKNNGFYIYKNGQFKLLYQHDTPIEYSRVTSTQNGDIWFCHQDTLFQVSVKGERSFTVQKDFILDVLPLNRSLYIWCGHFFDDKRGLKFSELVNYIKEEKPEYEKIIGQPISWLEDKTPNLTYHFPVVDKVDYQWIIQKERAKNTLIGQTLDNQILFEEIMPLNSQSETDQSLNVNIRELYIDKQNNIWVTSDNGIYKINHRQMPFKSYLTGQSTRGIFRLGNQLLVNHQKVSSINLETNEKSDLDLPLKRLTFFKDKNKLWIGTEYGLTYWEEDWNVIDWTKTDWKKSDLYFRELKGHYYLSPYRSRNNNCLWMGTSKGLTYLEPKTDAIIAFVSNNERLNTATIRYIYENPKGVWLITNQGVFLMNLNGTVLKEYSLKTGFPTDDFYHLHEDKNGIFWLGSSDIGLLRWNPKTDEKTVFGREQGFLNENIYAVYEDENDFLWLPSDYGLIRFNKETYEINTYLEEHGLPNNEFNTYSHYQDSLGNLYFGGLNGIVTFDPKGFIKNTALNIPIHLTAFKVLSKGASTATDYTRNAQLTQQLIFRPQDKLLEVHFALMDFKNTKQRLYTYKINGYDENWNYTTNNSIRINSLPYGQYQLIIKGQVDGIAWSSDELILDIIVVKPFYLQWWFIFLVLAIIVISLIVFFKYRTRQLLEEQIRLEQIVQERTAKIESDKKVIEAQAEKLQELDKAKTKFFSNITHEFRTPLTLILGPTKQLYEAENEPKKQKQLAGIFRNARHLLDLINQLLDISKLEDKKMTVRWQYGNIIEYSEALVESFVPLAKSKQQKLSFVTNETVWETYFDQDKWHKIIFNLLSNAIKYTEENGKIELTLHRISDGSEETIYLTVEDNGMGIQSDNLAQIFNRFYQVDDTMTRFQEGVGIGLSLVKELVELQDGTIEVKSAVGEGTTFVVKIPIPQNAMEITKNNHGLGHLFLNQLEIPAHLQIKTTPKSIGLLQVLIIEDNPDMSEYIQSCLEATKYTFTFAKDGQEGIEKAIEVVPDLIISDVMMPRKDGFEVVTAIRKNLATSHIPIILLTAKAALDSRLEGLNRGADAYMTKPFSPKELMIRIEQLIKLRQIIQQRYQNKTEETQNEDTCTTYQQEDDFIIELKTYILKNIAEPTLSVTSIGEHFLMSRTQLYRKVKALTNESVNNFIVKIRLETALKLIKTKKYSLSEIAYDTGFSSPSYFSRIFKRTYGKSPSEVRD